MHTVQAYVAAAPGNAMVSINMPRSGKIVGIQYAISADFDADAEAYSLELATVPTLQCNTNAAQGTIAVWRALAAVGAAGTWTEGQNGYLPIPSIGVEAGQLLYINGFGSASIAVVTLLIYLQ